MPYNISYILSLLDRFTPGARKIAESTTKLKRTFISTREAAKHLGAKIDMGTKKFTGLGNTLGGVGAAFAGLNLLKKAAEAEDAIQDVARVTGLSDEALKKLDKSLKKIALQYGITANEVRKMAFEGGKINITGDKLVDYVKLVAKTKTAFTVPAEQAGKDLGSIRQKLGLTTQEVDQLMQVVNHLAETTGATGGRMVEIIARAAPIFAEFGFSRENIASWAAFADMISVTPELAASGITMMLRRLKKMPPVVKAILKDEKNLTKFLARFLDITDETQRMIIVQKLFGDEASRFATPAIKRLEEFKKTREKAFDPKALISMDVEVANILDRTSTRIGRLITRWLDLSEAMGKPFAQSLKDADPLIKKIGDRLAEIAEERPIFGKILQWVITLTTAIVGLGWAARFFLGGIKGLGFLTKLLPLGAATGAAAAIGLGLKEVAVKTAEKIGDFYYKTMGGTYGGKLPFAMQTELPTREAIGNILNVNLGGNIDIRPGRGFAAEADIRADYGTPDRGNNLATVAD